jgi:ribosomal protein L37AE/L43A
MDVVQWMSMSREERKNEPGTMPPCPFCGRPRVQRETGYIRCTPCGTNWLDGEDWDTDPRNPRMQKFIQSTKATASATKAATA